MNNKLKKQIEKKRLNNTHKSGNIIIISGPSGVGKGTVINKLKELDNSINIAISATTRLPRKDEVHKENYYFLSEEEFKKEIKKDNFIEYCEVHGNMYGTLCEEVERYTSNQKDILLEIDTNGASKIKNKCPEAITVFLAPPSFEELEKRLRLRNTEEQSQLNKRLERAKEEMLKESDYDYVVINTDIVTTAKEIYNIMSKYTDTK